MLLCCQVQRRKALVVTSIHIGTACNEKLNHLSMPVGTSSVQCGKPVFPTSSGAHSRIDKPPNLAQVICPHCTQ
jgi:hypothetical protein